MKEEGKSWGEGWVQIQNLHRTLTLTLGGKGRPLEGLLVSGFELT